MQHIFIITNREKDVDLVLTNHIKLYLEARGVRCTLPDVGSREQAKVLPKDVNCVLVLGGDGTLIQSARDLRYNEFPLLGVNIGTLGYLTEVEPGSVFEALDHLLRGEYGIEERMMISGEILRDGQVIYEDVALNDIVFMRNSVQGVVEYNIYVDGQYIGHYKADGAIIATPTGSTAYNLSAGGPIVMPEASLFVFTPISPHTLNSRSVIFPDYVTIELEAERQNHSQECGITVNFDGDTRFNLKSGDRVKIKKAIQKTKLIRISNVSFLEILRKKMM
ncbi:MAG: NAD(+)/NADH kinase [Lachnospiraceae bacterium]